ncbi:ABC transporter substrate-binding protein [Microbacterium fluvii]|uniref:ABC transporter substrate-binding protein n=1 Tax=Microbacterium fluvii TaxID=415215 RepID=A0ABW2HI38_9MICO|nr:ABC transporter substrate-binding protein [Microbacterium fluvii]MCU4673142.1 ABC transporter substrate-binding protein [Microbacterium fluvii]
MSWNARRNALAALVAAALLLTGCAGAAAEPTASAGQTRQITDVEGTVVEVPVDPQRVVTLSEPTLDAALALGIEPIGTVSGRGQSTVPNYLADLAGDIPILGGVAQPNYEAIGAVDPDLILVDGTSINNNPPVIEALRHIAPVVYTGYAGGPWRDNFLLVADALNLADEGAQVVADYEAHVADAAAALTGYADDTFSIVRWQGTSASVILKELPPGQALVDLGLQRPADQDRTGRGHSEPVSLENLETIDADHIFFGTLGGSSVDNRAAGGSAGIEDAAAALAEAETVPGFTDLQAYRDDAIILVDGSAWTSTGGPLLMNRIIDDVVAALS